MSASPSEPICTACGQPDAHEVGDELLCPACAHERGSCGAVAHEDVAEGET